MKNLEDKYERPKQTFTLSLETLQKHLLALLDRYRVYNGEHKKPTSFHVELLLTICGTREIGAQDEKVDEFIQTLAYIEYTFECDFCNLEFLQHKNHFHPTFSQWYYCEDTTTIEVVTIIEEMLKEL